MAITVVKIGGNVIDNPGALEAFVKDFARLPAPKILVHGGGKLATAFSRQLGIETRMIEGRRITDKETLDVVTMVYAGLVNKNIVAMLQREKCKCIGLSGADANIIPAKRRDPNPVDYGYVGDIDVDMINVSALATLLDGGITPVFCALTHDGHGSMLNSNADSVASAVAIAATKLDEVDLVYCFELPGVMRDIDDANSLICDIDEAAYAHLRQEGVISKGMIPKIDNAFSAVRQGVRCVVIRQAQDLGRKTGTTIHL